MDFIRTPDERLETLKDLGPLKMPGIFLQQDAPEVCLQAILDVMSE